ncbi:hypothetical protein A2837_00465 [Candidatus Kaiserbacteria bacterium RIFCSPHIGHO2_01_FULL_46_22]|uniref:Uncharacterized protein n=1 Tax=Candidatus Kaiserbacteria bacterium RIFCSPHIGHO2_01_FULL_46_22 TaxID=1798475 RepID=A0A1F6BXX5_9BACT|nr:MAG: hypothetical protein A2837_00465 [Candidatus Kaiserbacteria bacterium RIFCSPHIGHO2_01_FULL_46_22]
MSESLVLDEMQERIKNLAASGKYNGQLVAALQDFGYEIIDNPILGKGVSVSTDGERVVCYHPELTDQKEAADPP